MLQEISQIDVVPIPLVRIIGGAGGVVSSWGNCQNVLCEVNLLGGNSPWHCTCLRISFQGCLNSELSWELEIIKPFRSEGMFVS